MRQRRLSPPGAPFAVLAAFAGVAACSESPVGGYETTVELTAEPTTAAVDEPITFHFEAQGWNLAGVVLSFGDGAVDSIPARAAQTAGGHRAHRYLAAGVYVAIAEAIEADGETATADVAVEIREADNGSGDR